VFAFAQPFIPLDQEVKVGRKAVSVYVDNSFSMAALSEDVPLLEKAKQRAREIISAYGIEDRFQVLTNDFAGRNQRTLGQEEALALVDEIAIGPAVRALSTVVARQEQALKNSDTDNRLLYLISDFQRNVTDLTTWEDSTTDLTLIPLQAVRESNVAIDSAWFEGPVPLLNQNNRLLVRLQNYSDEDLDNVRLTVKYSGQQKPEGVLELPARTTLIDTVNINVSQPGWQEVTLSITDYPITFDDDYHLAFRVAEKVRVLNISDEQPNRYLRAVLEGLSVFDATFQTSQGLDYGQMGTYQMIVLDDLQSISTGLAAELQRYVRSGGNLLVFPPRGADLASYQSFLGAFPANVLENFSEEERTVGSINTDEFVFNDVFENRSDNLRLPVTQGNFNLSRFSGRQEEVLMSYRDGAPYLTKYRSDQGHLYLCTAPLSDAVNNLVQNAEIFVPMLYKMAISAGVQRPVAYTIGKDEVIITKHQPHASEAAYKLRGSGQEFIPEQRIVSSQVYLGVDNQVSQAGFYQLFLNEDEPLDRFAFNYNRRESALDYFRPE
ncbi:MAG: hypothetical protein KDC54_14485, partial [Lewinella sp.]|nr:hypothetical protein [Lewinella sp.]